jgi:hypothetical protein
MRLVKVSSAANRPLRIVQLGDLDLIYCIPWTVAVVIIHALRLAGRALVFLPSRLANRLVLKLNWNCAWLIALIPFLWAGAATITRVGGAFSWMDVASAVLVVTLGGIIPWKLDALISGAEWETSGREKATFGHWVDLCRRLPEGFFHSPHSARLWVVGALGTAFWLVTVVALALAPHSWLRYALIAVLLHLSFTYNFEPQEHCATHSPNGRLVKDFRKAPLLGLLELARRFLFYPANGWIHDYYFMIHALHHHVENDGPADPQSLARDDRSSVLGFFRSVFWHGVDRTLPIETFMYFAQRGTWRLVGRLLFGYLLYVPVFAFLYWINPWLALTPFWGRLPLGLITYLDAGQWHAFQLQKTHARAYASSGAYEHYVHHKKPNLHSDDAEGFERHFQSDSVDQDMLFFKPEYTGLRGYLYPVALMWQRNYEALGHCLVRHTEMRKMHPTLRDFTRARNVAYSPVNAERVKEAVEYCHLPRSSPLDRYDRWASNLASRVILRWMVPRPMRVVSGTP